MSEVETRGVSLDEGVRDLADALAAERAARTLAEQRYAHLLYLVSHDLPEPVRMVRGFLSLIAKRYAAALDDDGRQFIELALDGGERLHAMLDALLRLSRVGTRVRAKEKATLAALVDGALARERVGLERAGAAVTVHVGEVVVDVRQVREALAELIANARTFHDLEGGGGPIKVHIDSVSAGGRVGVRVADNGIGVAEADRERALALFVRLHGRDRFPGLGAGLAFAQAVAERHGGEVVLDESSLGGVMATLWLPDPGIES
jgi:signal transduction histidine kinase